MVYILCSSDKLEGVSVIVSYTDGVCVVFQQQVRRRIWDVQHV